MPPNEVSAQRQALMAQQHNAAVSDMEKVANRYNQAVRAFKDNKEPEDSPRSSGGTTAPSTN